MIVPYISPLQFGYGNKVTAERTIQLDAARHTVSNAALPRIRASKQIAELDMDYARNKKSIEQLGRQYGIVTRNTSLIVLESVNDYVQYGIEPPAELRSEYDAIIKQRNSTATQAATMATADARASFLTLKDWWKKSFTPAARQVSKPAKPIQQQAQNTPAAQAQPARNNGTTDNGEIYGTIIDEHKEPMMGCTIQAEQRGIVRGGTVSDIDGNYSIKPLQPGTYDLRISYAGYKVQMIRDVLLRPGQGARVNAAMETATLKEVVVALESRNSRPLNNSSATTTSFTQKDIHNIPTNNMNDVAATQVSIVQQKSGGSLNIGGSRTEGTMYIIDGVQVQGNRSISQTSENIEDIISGVAGDYGEVNGGVVQKAKQQTDYISVLKKAGKSQLYDTYLRLRKTHTGDPVFYFTVAGYFMEHEQQETGLRILSNMAELSFQDHEVYKMLGYKLRETGQKEDAVYVFRKVMEWRPDEPQSYRDYALALADAGYTQRALDTLCYAINRKYDADIMSKYRGIGEIIVTKINQLMSTAKKPLSTDSIPADMVQSMPVDARVVINWNMDDTDIDLWVTDPAGEKCYYSHKQTESGGRISTDFTQGYGPEQFMIRKAQKGRYKIEINYYGDRQLRLAGATTVFAEIYTYYGTPKQQRNLVTLQLQKSDDDKIAYIGSFDF